jgi:hypothetical protein
VKDYLSEMLNALTSAYSARDYANRQRGSPLETNIGKLFSIFTWGLESVHEQAELLKLWDNIDYAKGSVLDRYGANFGVRRNGASDAFYRLLIKVKLLSQLSGGDIDTVINAAASLFGIPAEKVSLAEVFPAKISMAVNEADLDPETLEMVADIAAMLKRILAAGVGLITTLQSYREFRSDVRIQTAVLDRSHLFFSLPEAKRSFTQSVGVAHAVFENTRTTFEPSPSKGIYCQTQRISNVLFEHAKITARPVY